MATKNKHPKYIFSVVLWDETGNKLLFKRDVGVRRASQSSAKEVVIKKYPRPYFIELKNIEN